MAKKKTANKTTTAKTARMAKLNARDKKTLNSLVGMADDVERFASRGRAPHIEIPSRSLSNVKYNKSRKIIEMGSSKNKRELFNESGLLNKKSVQLLNLLNKICSTDWI